MKRLLALALGLAACHQQAPPMGVEDAYTALRIVNNEVGRLLNEYAPLAVSKAQSELDMRARLECKPEDAACRQGIKTVTVQKYAARQKFYNDAHEAQSACRVLLEVADGACKDPKSATCKAARDDALTMEDTIQRVWKEVSSW